MNSVHGIERNKLLYDIDSITTLKMRHKKVHEGKTFSISGIVTINADATLYLGVKTGLTNYSHITLPLITTNKEELEVTAYEDGNYTTSGAIANTIQNHNRASNIVSDTQESYLGVTVVSLGNLFYSDLIAGMSGIAGTVGGGNNKEIEEFILKKDTIYILALKNTSDTQCKASLYAQWYEKETI